LGHRASMKRFVSLQFLNLRHSVGFPGRGISPSQSRYPTQTQNKRKQTSMPWVGFEPRIPVFDRAKAFYVLDRAATVIGSSYSGCSITKIVMSLHGPLRVLNNPIAISKIQTTKRCSTFWNITSCSPLKVNGRFGGKYCLSLQSRRVSQARNQREAGGKQRAISLPEYGGDMFFRSLGWLSTVYMALYPRR
jgi:hypothetical protein